ncbi:MAG: hypothetical protein ACI89G_002598, partial [Minisyncoccia bacterium]
MPLLSLLSFLSLLPLLPLLPLSLLPLPRVGSGRVRSVCGRVQRSAVESVDCRKRLDRLAAESGRLFDGVTKE